MKHFFSLTFVLFCFICYSQNPKITKHGNDTIQVISYHKNGHVKDSVWKTIEILVGKRETIDPKHPGDSIVMTIETPFGTEKRYYKNGRRKAIIYYGQNGSANKTFRYRKKGSLAVYEETPYGVKKLYNKKGRQIRESDYNKDKIVRLPKHNKEEIHLSQARYATLPLTKTMVLRVANKQVKIKSGAMVSILSANDTAALRHCVFEGYRKDSLVFTKYSYDLSESKNKLKLDSSFVITVKQLNTIYYSTNNARKTHLGASVMEFSGFNMTFLPIIVVPLFAGVGTLLTPPALAIVVAGIPVYICGKSLFKKTVPKAYKLSEWKIKN